jgi:hypothetical protein
LHEYLNDLNAPAWSSNRRSRSPKSGPQDLELIAITNDLGKSLCLLENYDRAQPLLE